jgi:hypothetical protein
VDYFLNVLTATDTAVKSVPQGQAQTSTDSIRLALSGDTLVFSLAQVGGYMVKGGKQALFADTIINNDVESEPRAAMLSENGLAANPNPFKPGTVIQYRLSAPQQVKLEIFTIRGELVQVTTNEKQGPGLHRVAWNAANKPAGLYLCKLISGKKVFAVKLFLVK